MRCVALALTMFLATLGSGCMTYVAATIKPGPHSDVVTVGALGTLGDAGVAAGASMLTAASTVDDEPLLDYFWPFAAGLGVLDLIAAVAVLDARFGD